MPAADRFRPDMVLISAGFDSRAGDTLGGFTLTDGDFTDLTLRVMEIAAATPVDGWCRYSKAGITCQVWRAPRQLMWTR